MVAEIFRDILARVNPPKNEPLEERSVRKSMPTPSPSAVKQALSSVPTDTENVRENVDILRTDDLAVRLPQGMSIDEAIVHLHRKAREEETFVKVYEEVLCYPADGAVALQKALAEIYGWTSLEPTPGFWGDLQPPVMKGVLVGLNETVKVPWGRMAIPGIDGYLETGQTYVKGQGFRFILKGEVKQKDYTQITDLATKTREIVAASSIYRGKALLVNFDSGDPMSDLRFLALQPDPFVFSRHIERSIAASVFTPIQHREKCAALGLKMRRGVLFAGGYGTGKTLVASAVGDLCVKKGITFFLVHKPEDLEKALELAAYHTPCVVFVEDLERVSHVERDYDTNQLLNRLDGVMSKNTEIMVIATTNHLEQIHPATLRPGRFDDVIHVEAPDAEAVSRLLRLYGGNLLRASDEELQEKVGGPLAGQIPAVIAEVVKRSVLYALTRDPGSDSIIVTADDLAGASQSILSQVQLINGSPVVPPPPLDDLFRNIIRSTVDELLSESDDAPTVIQEIHEKVTSL